MSALGSDNISAALSDFRQARTQAILKEIMARFTGEPTELLSYEEVRKQLRAIGSSEKGLQNIPLEAIVGSVSRYSDFTRGFLPRKSTDEYRWANVKLATLDMVGLPPIDVYKIGEVYFVKDGNHRVSVARQLGGKTIQAYITEVKTRVPLEPDTQPDELILKAEYAEFLEHTNLDQLRPDADLNVTAPGQYPNLEEHIAVHRHYMGLEGQRHIPYDEAVTHWYDFVYLPVIQPIRDQGILHYYPGRTEADLYLWIAEHRAHLEEDLGWIVEMDVAASDLLNQALSQPAPFFSRIGNKILDVITSGKLESGPPVGAWREQKQSLQAFDKLFADILIPVSGEPAGWIALEQAFVLAHRDESRLNGLHIVENEAEIDSEQALSIQAEFSRRCNEQGIAGHLAIKSGDVARQIATQARLNDLVVTALLYPPPPQPLARLDSGFRELIARTPRPVLAVPQIVAPFTHAIMAYDGSSKAQEALFVSAYLAESYQSQLTVITVFDESDKGKETLLKAKVYLEDCGITAGYISAQGSAAEQILLAADECSADFIVMGGYGQGAVASLVLGSVVDQVLREAHKPVLICR